MGTVEIVAKGSDYLLTFLLGHSVLYKGLGVLSGDGRAHRRVEFRQFTRAGGVSFLIRRVRSPAGG